MYRLLLVLFPSLLLSSCIPAQTVVVSVRFAAYFGEHALDCDSADESVQLTDLRFYVSGLHFHSVDGGRVTAELAANGRWQSDAVALVDLEDGTGSCVNGTPDDNDVVLARVPAGDYRGLEFIVGVPFTLNHEDPLRAAAPLDDSTMHWHWRSGYKFLRAGVSQAGSPFLLHLGSAACEGTVPAIRGCRYPNRVTIMLDDWRPDMTVAVDLRVLTQSVEASGGDAHCESAPADPDCAAIQTVLGLDGNAGDPAAQPRLFQVRRL